MSEGGFSDRIAHLERRIGELAKTVEHCSKAMLIAKIAGSAGAIWLAAMTIGLVRFSGLALILSLSAMIGGFVVFGSSRSTSLQAAAAIQEAEAERSALIGSLELRTVEEMHRPSIAGSRLLH
jgi:hypothetical protein